MQREIKKICREKLNFEDSQWSLKAADYKKTNTKIIKAIAKVLKENPLIELMINGIQRNAGPNGNAKKKKKWKKYEKYIKDLPWDETAKKKGGYGHARACAVKEYLIDQGIDEDRLTIKSEKNKDERATELIPRLHRRNKAKKAARKKEAAKAKLDAEVAEKVERVFEEADEAAQEAESKDDERRAARRLIENDALKAAFTAAEARTNSVFDVAALAKAWAVDGCTEAELLEGAMSAFDKAAADRKATFDKAVADQEKLDKQDDDEADPVALEAEENKQVANAEAEIKKVMTGKAIKFEAGDFELCEGNSNEDANMALLDSIVAVCHKFPLARIKIMASQGSRATKRTEDADGETSMQRRVKKRFGKRGRVKNGADNELAVGRALACREYLTERGVKIERWVGSKEGGQRVVFKPMLSKFLARQKAEEELQKRLQKEVNDARQLVAMELEDLRKQNVENSLRYRREAKAARAKAFGEGEATSRVDFEVKLKEVVKVAAANRKFEKEKEAARQKALEPPPPLPAPPLPAWDFDCGLMDLEAAKAYARAKGLRLGTDGVSFSSDAYATKGLYAYRKGTPTFGGVAFYGTGGSMAQVETPINDPVSGRYRPQHEAASYKPSLEGMWVTCKDCVQFMYPACDECQRVDMLEIVGAGDARVNGYYRIGLFSRKPGSGHVGQSHYNERYAFSKVDTEDIFVWWAAGAWWIGEEGSGGTGKQLYTGPGRAPPASWVPGQVGWTTKTGVGNPPTAVLYNHEKVAVAPSQAEVAEVVYESDDDDESDDEDEVGQPLTEPADAFDGESWMAALIESFEDMNVDY